MAKAKRRSPGAPEEDFLRQLQRPGRQGQEEKISEDEDNDKKGKIKKKYIE
ncbi:MAG: hypothetical protein PUA93_05085 [Eubacteriales bacterium]|nr:hypothetical protein [Eubacteriales bacterium]